ncbi:MAG TPA: SWIM zinc finger family protein [Ilumatobacteraceae bacterium]|nr:SWIM zinc finger family protein [Ilumatobacteraceae bacterium]
MSRPRKPFGANHPGRLPATMMKVLAAEMSDPSRLRRGKQYAKDGSVLDIVIDPGTVTCEIQGSRSTPYIAVVAVTPGNGMPLRRDVRYTCTCPDADNWDNYACKHVVATMFTLSDEFLLEPELLDLWRGRASEYEDHDDRHDDRRDTDDDPQPVAAGSGRTGRHLRLVRPGDGAAIQREPAPPRTDPLADLLRIPAGAALPEVGEIDRIEPQLPRSRELAAVLRDALGNLRIEWD